MNKQKMASDLQLLRNYEVNIGLLHAIEKCIDKIQRSRATGKDAPSFIEMRIDGVFCITFNDYPSIALEALKSLESSLKYNQQSIEQKYCDE